MIRNIVFDVGKVLIGWSPAKSMEMIGFSKEETEAVMNALFTDKNIWREEDRGVKTREEMTEYLVSFAPELGDLIRRFYADAVLSATPLDYTRPWLTGLKEAGYRVYVLSNFGEYAQHRAVEIGAINFMDLLDGYIYSYMIKEIKPERAIYEALINKYSLLPEECVFIDDVEENVVAARETGMEGFVFTGYEDAVGRLNEMGVIWQSTSTQSG